ncbi:acyltransferase [Rhizobium herbae]|uniref:Acyltransferase n=1 Tax=Rhizobium herbae TaxID=508661 RepID=A0ABS7HEZ3_9HYPH|nr:acyltransferase [Rhizobium herbae]MBW9065859.1 acyltransferase [Rhizobium herbae]
MSNTRDRQLDGLRAIAVTMVLYAHFFAENGDLWGHLGVRLFFVLSGFLITRLLLDARDTERYEPSTALKSFYIRRALRIFPPYFAMLGFIWVVNLEGARANLAWHALYLSNFWYAIENEWSPWVLCHTWSLSIEEQFYVLWPLVILLAPRQLIERICIAVIACSLAYRLCWPVTGAPTLMRDLLPTASMDALASGALLAAYRARSASWPRWMKLSWMPSIAAVVILAWPRPTMTPALDWAAWIGTEVLPLLPLTMLVGCCSAGIRGYFGRAAEFTPLTALGRISYGVYLFHPIVLSLVVKAQAWIPVNVSEQGPGRFVVAGAATLILASLSWSLFETRLNRLKRHFPYVATADHSRAGSFLHAGNTVEWSGDRMAPRSVMPACKSADRGKAFQTSDLQ